MLPPHFLHPCENVLGSNDQHVVSGVSNVWLFLQAVITAACLCVFKLQVKSCSISPLPAGLPCAKLHRKVIFWLFIYFCVWAVKKNFRCSENDGTEKLHQVSTLQQLFGRFLPLGNCMYLTIVSMVQHSSFSPPPPPLLLLSFPRIHLTCLPSIFHSSPPW